MQISQRATPYMFSKIRTSVFFLIVFNVYAQDTIFNKSHDFEKYISNITTDGQNLYLRIGDSIYSYSNGEKKYITNGALRFSFIKKNDYAENYYWYHDEQIPKLYSSSNYNLNSILPGPQNAFITLALLNNNLFICYNGNLLEYKINQLPKLVHRGKSVRHIYSNNNIRVISTYSGVYLEKVGVNLSLKFEGEKILPHSHGEFTKVGSHFYLCQGAHIYRYDEENNTLELFKNFQDYGGVRQLIEFENKVFIISLEGLAVFDLENKKASEPLIEDKITRAKKIGSELIVVTKTGAIYRISDQFKINKIQTNFSFEDVEKVNDEILIGGKSGLFKLVEDQLLKLDNSMEFYELHEYKENLIFSNFQGLYVWLNSRPTAIVNDVEFNRYALSHDQGLLYAGSINGLYTISTYDFDIWLRNQKGKEEFNIKKAPIIDNYMIYVMLSLIILSMITIIYRYRIKLQKSSFKWTEKDFSIEFIEEVIRNNKIVSVEDLANHLNISRVQLNRKLSKENTTALKVLKECKNKIANELYKKGVSLEKISKQLGYSKRYIKENFLKKS